MYDFYVENGIHMVSFNIEEIDGVNGFSSLHAPCAEMRFRLFLRRFIERMRRDPGRIRLRELQNALSVIRDSGLHGRRAQDAEPFRILSVDVSGSVATFSPELIGTSSPIYGDFSFGNVKTELDGNHCGSDTSVPTVV